MKLKPWDSRGLRFHYNWTRHFIRDFGWKSYVRVVWVDSWVYRFQNWRCWFGHELGEIQWQYEDGYGYGYDAWRECERPHCTYSERVGDDD
jgi:hypothetical protein